MSEINCLNDLKRLRSAPILNKIQEQKLFEELSEYIKSTDWFTIGIMAKSKIIALCALKEMESCFNWKPMVGLQTIEDQKPVFLKANQKTGDVHIRIEYGLGEGVLIGCHHDHEGKDIDLLGPFPLSFFKFQKINL